MISVAEARRLYGGAQGVHDFDHALRVLHLALRIAHAEDAGVSVVRPAALLHDIGRQEDSETDVDHTILGAARAREILSQLPEVHTDQTEAIIHAIRAHRFRAEPQPSTLEAQVLYDADKLDAIGAVGVARAFAYGGAHGQRLWAHISSVNLEQWSVEGDDPDTHTPVHEYVVKLSRIKDLLFTTTAREIAEERHKAMVAFFERLTNEVRGLA